jgi:hypothetical protein
MHPRIFTLALILAAPFAAPLRAWDFDGHRMVNRVALASLPKEFPTFVQDAAAIDRVVYLANLPDRWRNVDPWLQQTGPSWTDHFCDLEQLPAAGLDARTVPSLRLDFALVFAAGRLAHAENFPAIDQTKNAAHTREWPGFLPWAITEWYQKLRSAFAYLKAYQEVGGTPAEIANAQADAIYAMGVMGHYVGDGAQPLHTTESHHGWVGDNPHGYTTDYAIHSWIDSGFIAKAGIKVENLLPRASPVEPLALPAESPTRDPFFTVAMDYLIAQNALVEPLYQLEKAGKLAVGDQPVVPEGREFIEARLLTGGQMLARIWLTAWRTAPVDTYLRTQLAKRQAPATVQPAPAPVKTP